MAGYLEGDSKKTGAYDDKLGFLTELGCEAANLGIQIFGGHGYIRKHVTNKILRPFAWELIKLAAQWNVLTVRLMQLDETHMAFTD